MHQAPLMLLLHLQSFGGVTRVWPFGELRIPLLHAFPAPSHLPHSKYDTQMTQILLEEYIFILNGKSTVVRSFVRSWWSSFFMYLRTYSTVQYSTVLLYMCGKQNTRRTTGTRGDTHHGQYKGTHPRASQGRALRC